MAAKMRIFSGLALTAATLFVVPLSSEVASARGGHGGGGMRSIGIVRTGPVVISRARTPSATVLHKQSSTLSRPKLTTTRTVGNKNTTNKLVNKNRIQTGTKTSKLKTIQDGSGGESTGGGGGGTEGTPPVVTPTGKPPVAPPPPATPPVVTLPPTGKPPVALPPTGTPPVVTLPPPVVTPPPVIVVDPVHSPKHHPTAGGVTIEAAPVAVDPPGCVYERSVRKLPGGGLQRVIVKICPDA